jgi:ammonia channel protein AmtB
MDAAGAGVIHMTGGICGLITAVACGPRLGRFKPIREGGDLNKTETEMRSEERAKQRHSSNDNN